MKTIVAVMFILAVLGSQGFSQVTDDMTIGCRTADLIASWNASGGNLIQNMVGRPITQCSWPSPYGRFRIHYDTSGTNAVYDPNQDAAPQDGIPDYINRAAEYLSISYGIYTEQLGFDPPPFDGNYGGDSLYDIYFTEIIGETTPEDPSEQYPGRIAYTSFIQLGHDLRYPQRYGDDPLPFLRANVSHELFHAFEFAYRAMSADITPWWYEACANWGEERVFDDLNDVYFELPEYLHNSNLSLYNTNGRFYYGSWLFPEYLDERFGPSVVRQCWEWFINYSFSITAIDFALQANGTNFNDEYCRHVIWNYFTGPNYHIGFYDEGQSFGTTVVTSKSYSNFPITWMANPLPLENVASTYIVFNNPGIPQGNLHIGYVNPTAKEQAVVITVVGLGGTVFSQIHQVQTGVPMTFDIFNFAADDKVIMMPVWKFEGYPKDDTTSYLYEAYLDSTLTGVTEPLEVSNRFKLNGAYPNPFNAAVAISFDVPAKENYRFTVYDIGGRELFHDNGQSQAGTNIIEWHASPEIASGILFYIIDLHAQRLMGKLSFVK